MSLKSPNPPRSPRRPPRAGRRAAAAAGFAVSLAVVLAMPAGASPEASPWSSGGTMKSPRVAAMITYLHTGKILVAGGLNGSNLLSSADLYAPSKSGGAGTWTATGSMTAPRQSAGVVTLYDGRALVVGGKGTSNAILKTAELFDPSTGKWSVTGSMRTARNGMTATLLYDGKVLVAGGTDIGKPVDPLSSAELYDPATGMWAPTGAMTHAHAFGTAVLLPSGKVLVAGGVTSSDGTVTNATDIYDPVAGTWSSGGAMSTAREHQMAVLLFNGRVLEVGGQGTSGPTLTTADLYTPKTGVWSSGGTFSGGRMNAALDVLYSGHILLAGGFGGNGNTVLSSADVYYPSGGGGAGTWKVVTAMPAARGHPMDIRLNTGPVLVAGGWADDGGTISLQSAVKYSPSPLTTLIEAPGYGLPGMSVKVSGSGFQAGEQVKLFWESTVLATPTTNSTGAFAVTITVPADATEGGHLTKAVGQSSGDIAQRWFAVTGP